MLFAGGLSARLEKIGTSISDQGLLQICSISCVFYRTVDGQK